MRRGLCLNPKGPPCPKVKRLFNLVHIDFAVGVGDFDGVFLERVP